MPMLAAPPGRFSRTIGCPSLRPSSTDNTLKITSVDPPAANGTMIFTGLVG
jgi:hypothetical protein